MEKVIVLTVGGKRYIFQPEAVKVEPVTSEVPEE